MIPEMERAENFTSKCDFDYDLQDHVQVKSNFLNGKPLFWSLKSNEQKILRPSVTLTMTFNVILWSSRISKWNPRLLTPK